MLRGSVIFLFISSLFLLMLFWVSQGGPDWEVSQSSVVIMEFSSLFASIFMCLGTITFLIKVKQFIKIENKVKYLYVFWYLILLICFIVVIKNGGPIDAFRLNSPNLQEKTSLFNLLGILISFTLLISLFITFKQKSNAMNESNK